MDNARELGENHRRLSSAAPSDLDRHDWVNEKLVVVDKRGVDDLSAAELRAHPPTRKARAAPITTGPDLLYVAFTHGSDGCLCPSAH